MTITQKLILLTVAGLPAFTSLGAELSPRNNLAMETKANTTNAWKDIQKAVDELEAAYLNSKDQSEREVLWKRFVATNDAAVPKAVKIAEQDPASAASFEILEWVLLNRRVQVWAQDLRPSGTRAVELLQKHHALNPHVAKVCNAIARRGDWDHKPGLLFLKEVSEKNPDRNARGQALLALGRLLKEKAGVLREFEYMPSSEVSAEARAKYAGWSKDGDSKDVAREAEQLLNLVVSSYADCPTVSKSLSQPKPAPIGEPAKRELFELTHLALGKVAPDVEGEDLDGRKFKLSDYRGKVVLLNFWASWCGPCMQMVPHERALAEKMTGRPFTVVGVNGDENLENARKAVAKEKMTWRSFWSAEGANGPIPNSWNIQGWPTVYVLDHRGVIRLKFEGYGGKRTDELLEKTVAGLLKEAEAEER